MIQRQQSIEKFLNKVQIYGNLIKGLESRRNLLGNQKVNKFLQQNSESLKNHIEKIPNFVQIDVMAYINAIQENPHILRNYFQTRCQQWKIQKQEMQHQSHPDHTQKSYSNLIKPNSKSSLAAPKKTKTIKKNRNSKKDSKRQVHQIFEEQESFRQLS